MSFVCEWPAAGIELTRHEIDAQNILDAAGRAQTLFPDRSSGSGGPRPSLVSHGLSQIATDKPKPPDSSASPGTEVRPPPWRRPGQVNLRPAV
jgi:hypothetical protein